MSDILTANRADLLTAVKRASTCVQHTATLAILGHLQLQATAGRLTVTGSDLQTEISAQCDCAGDDLLTTIPARKLAQILSGSTATDVKLSLGDTKATLIAGTGRFQLATLSGGDFPRLEASDGASDTLAIGGRDLLRLIDQVRYAAASSDVRYYLNGIHLDFRRGAKIVATATDGHRLARAELALDDAREIDRDLILPVAAVDAIRKIIQVDGPITLTLWDRAIRINSDHATISCKLIDGKYPQSDRVIPRDNPIHCTVDRLALDSAVKRVVVLANEQYKGVSCLFGPDSLSLTARNQDTEEATERVECDCTGDCNYGVNASYLIDAINAIGSERVQIHLRDATSSSLLRADADDSALHVLMPMRM